MFDPLVSYIRLLVGDNSRTAPTYTDDQIRESATVGPVRPSLPLALRICGLIGFMRYPFGGESSAALSLETLTDEQLETLTDEQLAELTD